MKCLLAKKVSMTQVYQGERVVPVTVLQAGPCVVTQVKTGARDGYTAIQMGFGTKRRLTKALAGHVRVLGKGTPRWMREFRIRDAAESTLAVGTTVNVDQFVVGDVVTVVGTSKGKGFAGVVKRHHFRGHPRTHGHKDALRKPGSIGAGGVQHVPKGRRMGGHMGDERVTVKNLRVVAVDPSANTLTISGAVPGARNSLVMVSVK